MAFIDEWTEWHLTPAGWREGSTKEDDGPTTTVPPPAGRVLTCQRYSYSGYWARPIERGVTEIWRSENEGQIKALLKEFGPCP